jgi:hypothetical protein
VEGRTFEEAYCLESVIRDRCTPLRGRDEKEVEELIALVRELKAQKASKLQRTCGRKGLKKGTGKRKRNRRKIFGALAIED